MLQKDHITVNIIDLLSRRYLPPVERHRYKIKFVPVVEGDLTEDQREAALSYDAR